MNGFLMSRWVYLSQVIACTFVLIVVTGSKMYPMIRAESDQNSKTTDEILRGYQRRKRILKSVDSNIPFKSENEQEACFMCGDVYDDTLHVRIPMSTYYQCHKNCCLTIGSSCTPLFVASPNAVRCPWCFQNRTSETYLQVHRAIAQRDALEVLQVLHLNGTSINEPDDEGFMPIHTAAAHGRLDVIEYLQSEYNASLNQTARDGTTVFHVALQYNQPDVVKMIASKHPEVLKERFAGGTRPIHYAANNEQWELVKWMIEQDGEQLNAEDSDGRRPIHYAAQAGRLEVVKWMVELDREQLNAEDSRGERPIHYAANNEQWELVKWMIEQDREQLNAEDSDGRRPIHYAAQAGRLEVVKWMVELDREQLNAQGSDGRLPIHDAANSEQWELVKWMIEQDGEQLNAEDSAGRRPIDFAEQAGQWELVKWMVELDGEQLNAEDSGGRQPIDFAVQNEHKDTVDLLAEAGSQLVHVLNTQVQSPRDLMSQNGASGGEPAQGIESIVELPEPTREDLAASEEDRRSTLPCVLYNETGLTPLHQAVLEDDAENIASLITNEALINARDLVQGLTPLEMAFEQEKWCALLALTSAIYPDRLTHDGNFTQILDGQGSSPISAPDHAYGSISLINLIDAIDRRNYQYLAWAVEQPELQPLLNEYTERGMTLLQEAVVANLPELVDALLALGADPMIPDLVIGNTSLEIAIEQEHVELANKIRISEKKLKQAEQTRLANSTMIEQVGANTPQNQTINQTSPTLGQDGALAFDRIPFQHDSDY